MKGGRASFLTSGRCARPSTLRLVGLAVMLLAITAGLVGRLWLLHVQPLTSDEAVVGLMAEQNPARPLLHVLLGPAIRRR